MKMPLLVSSSAQNSALIWKSLYDSLLTRYEGSFPSVILSATSAPSFIAQLALPTSVQSPILVPSTNVIQPSCPEAVPANWMAAAPIKKPAASVVRCLVKIVLPSGFWLAATYHHGT